MRQLHIYSENSITCDDHMTVLLHAKQPHNSYNVTALGCLTIKITIKLILLLQTIYI